MGNIVRLRTTFDRAVNATQYAAGDEISNHVTAGSVVRATWDMRGLEVGKILAAEMDITEGAGGNVVTTASDFELLIFRTSDAPAAVGDNVTHPIAAAVRALAVARFRFDDTGWTGPLGTVAAGTSQVQAVAPTLVQPLATNVLEYPVFAAQYAFNGTPLSAVGRSFTCVLRALAAWNPTAVANAIGITLDIETP